MAFITIVDTDDAFPWQPVDEESGKAYESSFELRIVPDDADKEIRKRHTRPTWEKKSRRMVDKLDDAAYIADILDYAIVGWSHIKASTTGQDVPCSTEMKARLPEKWKAEILRLCSGKEAGELAETKAEQEKKGSTNTSSSKSTASRIPRAV